MNPALQGCFPATIGRRIVPETELHQTEYYSGFARPFDMAEVMGGCIPLGGGKLAVYSMQRPSRMRQFDEDDEALARSFTPHLQRALQLRERLAPQADGVGFAALDRLAFGAIVCNSAGRVVFANAAAEEAADATGALILGGKATSIGALRPRVAEQLRALVREACSGSGGSLRLEGNGQTSVAVLATPLPRRFGAEKPLAMLAIQPLSAPSPIATSVLINLFNLTRAEAELTRALLNGASLAEIGAQRATTENTLRTQLRFIFQKTGARNQAYLVRLIGTLPWLR